MTPEERAREVADRLSCEAVAQEDGETYLDVFLAQQIIAAALCTARNEALEEAAKVADAEYEIAYQAERVSISNIAAAIRALKS